MEIQKIFTDMEGEEVLYSVLMTEEEIALFSETLDSLYKDYQSNPNQETARKYLDTWTTEVYIPHRKKGMLVDPSPGIVKAALGEDYRRKRTPNALSRADKKAIASDVKNKMKKGVPLKDIMEEYKDWGKQKTYSLSGRVKAARLAYKDGLKFYDSEGFKNDSKNSLKLTKEDDLTKYYKTKESKKAAKKEQNRLIKEYEGDILGKNIKKKSRSDAWKMFKSPYYKDRLLEKEFGIGGGESSGN